MMHTAQVSELFSKTLPPLLSPYIQFNVPLINGTILAEQNVARRPWVRE